MSKQPIDVLILDGDSVLSNKIATCLGIEKSYRIHCLAQRPNSLIRYSRFLFKYHHRPTLKSENGLLDVVIDIIKKNSIQLLIPVIENGIRFCIQHQETIKRYTKLGYIPTKKSLDAVESKQNFSKLCSDLQLPKPKTYHTENESLCNEIIDKIHFPIIIKPIYGGGGGGINKFNTKNDFQQWLVNSKIKINKYIIQEFVEGTYASFCAFCINGEIIAYTLHKGILKPYKSFKNPMAMEFFNDTAIVDEIKRLITELSWNGLFNLELIFKERTNEIYVLEVNPRIWESMYAQLEAGINFPHVYAMSSLGVNNLDSNYLNKRFIYLKKGMLKNILFYLRSFKISESDYKYLLYDLLPELSRKFKITK